jgi:hypothetical protein
MRHAGQAQKEIWHNEALALLDLVVQPVVQSIGDAAPPEAPELGQCHVVGPDAQAEWVGRERTIAGWTAAGWRFVEPAEGMQVVMAETMIPACYVEGAWRIGIVPASELWVSGRKVVGQQGAAVAVPSGGMVIDDEARAAISSIISALTEHGLIAASTA